MSSETIHNIEIYNKNYSDYTLNVNVMNKVFDDVLNIKGTMNKMDMKDFLKSSIHNHYGFKEGNESVIDMLVFGNSLRNPMYDIDILESMMLIKYCDSSVYTSTGMSYLDYKNTHKETQDTIINVLKNLSINKAETVSDTLESLNNGVTDE